jgi:hypothetical protein
MACTGFQDVVVVGVIRRVIVIVVGCVSSDDDAAWPLLLFLWTARTKTDKSWLFYRQCSRAFFRSILTPNLEAQWALLRLSTPGCTW